MPLLIVVAFLAQVTSARFLDSDTVAANQLSTRPCFQAKVAGVQTGTLTNNANGKQTVVITAVDPAKAFLIFNTSSNSDRPVGSTVRGRLATGTSLEFDRVTDGLGTESPTPATITIRWYVVEYSCGVAVQRGVATMSTTETTNDIAITPVGSLARSFVTFSRTALAQDAASDGNDWFSAQLAGTSTLRLVTNTVPVSHIVAWQVVEFLVPGDAAVQAGTTSMAGGSLTTSVTLPAAVDPDRSFVLVSNSAATSTTSDIGARMLTAQLTATTLTLNREITGGSEVLPSIAWQVVELKDGSRVQQGTTTLASGTASAAVTIDPVAATRASAFTSTQTYGSGQGLGRSPYTGDDIPGVASATLALTSTQVTLTRANTAAAATFTWFVVEWGGPPWWNTNYGFRRPVKVTTAAGAAPTAYSLLLSVDHAALVAAGAALSSGADLRVAWWSGTAWTELDRVLDDNSAWNSASTRLWFKSQAALSANAATTGYYLYYRNPSAGAPPANPRNVFQYSDDFSGASLDPAWTVLRPPTSAAYTVSGGRLNVPMDPNEDLRHNNNTAVVFSTAAPAGDYEVQATKYGSPTGAGETAGPLAYENDNRYAALYHDNIAGTQSWDWVQEDGGPATSQTGALSGDPVRLRIQKLANNYSAFRSTDGGLNWTSTGTTQSISLSSPQPALTAFSSTATVMTASFDDFRVRLLTSPEPATTAGAEDRP